MTDNNDKSLEEKYEELLKHSPKVAEYFRFSDMEFSTKSSEFTGDRLQDLWIKNAKQNLKEFPDYQLVKNVCPGFGFNKAVILIGAGPSFNKNKKLLKELCYANAQYEFEQQPFLLVCSNHQLKPCLKEGIIPHFVILMDSSDVVYDQLCKDIPKRGRGVSMLTSFRSDTKVLKEWKKQGRNILFFMLQSEFTFEELRKVHDDENLFERAIPPAGNVLNQAWLTTFAYMGASIFMALGNDLSYDYDDNVEKRRTSYYADEDYSSNIGTGRDEAKRVVPWMGFEQVESSIVPGYWMLKMVPKATTYQLVVYKIWLETRIGLQAATAKSFHYYNCSDGILGMLSKKEYSLLDKETFDDSDNWHLLDGLFAENYHTKPLIIAANEFLTARSIVCQSAAKEILEDIVLPQGAIIGQA